MEHTVFDTGVLYPRTINFANFAQKKYNSVPCLASFEYIHTVGHTTNMERGIGQYNMLNYVDLCVILDPGQNGENCQKKRLVHTKLTRYIYPNTWIEAHLIMPKIFIIQSPAILIYLYIWPGHGSIDCKRLFNAA
jgi:hypothetical protein